MQVEKKITERLAAIEVKARELLEEIEWVDAAGSSGGNFRNVCDLMLAAPEFHYLLRATLDAMFRGLRESPEILEGYVGHQEIELEAAGMVQSVVKRVIRTIAPDYAPLVDYMSLATKFSSMPTCFIQAPPNVWVPSMAEQMQMNTDGHR